MKFSYTGITYKYLLFLELYNTQVVRIKKNSIITESHRNLFEPNLVLTDGHLGKYVYCFAVRPEDE